MVVNMQNITQEMQWLQKNSSSIYEQHKFRASQERRAVRIILLSYIVFGSIVKLLPVADGTCVGYGYGARDETRGQ